MKYSFQKGQASNPPPRQLLYVVVNRKTFQIAFRHTRRSTLTSDNGRLMLY
jgi:hypothetical protein